MLLILLYATLHPVLTLVGSILPTTANQLGHLKDLSELMLSWKVCRWENGEIEHESCDSRSVQNVFQIMNSTLFLSAMLDTTWH
jgi:hypothetical protein